jgi:hypothetical protein
VRVSQPLPQAVVFDHTALLALGAGNRMASHVVTEAHREPGRYVYAPALCLIAAVADRPALADHVGMLPAVEVIDLGYAAAAEVGRLIGDGMDWRAAHAVDAARPSLEWPAGRPVITDAPDAYAGFGVRTIRLR